jgi:ADP-ribosylglycohydrolase
VADNTRLFDELIESKTIRMEASQLLATAPPALPRSLTFERVEGMLLGLATGDALGNTSEGLPPSERERRHGPIRDYLPNPDFGGAAVGLPSDDTQLTCWTMEVLLRDGRLVPEHLAQRFCEEPIIGIGKAVQQFVYAFKKQGLPWQQAGTFSAGNGALMRIAPLLLPHLRRPTRALWADAALAGMVTHNDPASNAACVAFCAMLWDLLAMEKVPPAGWWLERYCQVAAPLEGVKTEYAARMRGASYVGPVWQFAAQQIDAARRNGWSTRQAADAWGSGAYLLETIPNALFILEKHAHRPEEAILRAVNDCYDNDTVGAIVGAAVGALHGTRALPERWRKGLLGRTNDHDDGKLFTLIQQVRTKFWDGRSMLG